MHVNREIHNKLSEGELPSLLLLLIIVLLLLPLLLLLLLPLLILPLVVLLLSLGTCLNISKDGGFNAIYNKICVVKWIKEFVVFSLLLLNKKLPPNNLYLLKFFFSLQKQLLTITLIQISDINVIYQVGLLNFLKHFSSEVVHIIITVLFSLIQIWFGSSVYFVNSVF